MTDLSGLAQHGGATVLAAIEAASIAIEVVAVAVIVVAMVDSTVRFLAQILARPAVGGAFQAYRVRLGRGLILGLEILVAADVIRTVVVEPGLSTFAGLGLLVLIRTFLSWSLEVEIEGRWPWQGRPARDASPSAPSQGLGAPGDRG
jgi:uncharacterized membrane protein